MSPDPVRVACPHDCPDTCAMLVTVEDGVATRIQHELFSFFFPLRSQ